MSVKLPWMMMWREQLRSTSYSYYLAAQSALLPRVSHTQRELFAGVGSWCERRRLLFPRNNGDNLYGSSRHAYLAAVRRNLYLLCLCTPIMHLLRNSIRILRYSILKLGSASKSENVGWAPTTRDTCSGPTARVLPPHHLYYYPNILPG